MHTHTLRADPQQILVRVMDEIGALVPRVGLRGSVVPDARLCKIVDASPSDLEHAGFAEFEIARMTRLDISGLLPALTLSDLNAAPVYAIASVLGIHPVRAKHLVRLLLGRGIVRAVSIPSILATELKTGSDEMRAHVNECRAKFARAITILNFYNCVDDASFDLLARITSARGVAFAETALLNFNAISASPAAQAYVCAAADAFFDCNPLDAFLTSFPHFDVPISDFRACSSIPRVTATDIAEMIGVVPRENPGRVKDYRYQVMKFAARTLISLSGAVARTHKFTRQSQFDAAVRLVSPTPTPSSSLPALPALPAAPPLPAAARFRDCDLSPADSSSPSLEETKKSKRKKADGKSKSTPKKKKVRCEGTGEGTGEGAEGAVSSPVCAKCRDDAVCDAKGCERRHSTPDTQFSCGIELRHLCKKCGIRAGQKGHLARELKSVECDDDTQIYHIKMEGCLFDVLAPREGGDAGDAEGDGGGTQGMCHRFDATGPLALCSTLSIARPTPTSTVKLFVRAQASDIESVVVKHLRAGASSPSTVWPVTEVRILRETHFRDLSGLQFTATLANGTVVQCDARGRDFLAVPPLPTAFSASASSPRSTSVQLRTVCDPVSAILERNNDEYVLNTAARSHVGTRKVHGTFLCVGSMLKLEMHAVVAVDFFAPPAASTTTELVAEE